jgi:DNA-directed RNA polymerase subunit RPC12/RpoP
MMARITCPACQSQFSIPEGDMGKRQVCRNCHCPFYAGTSVTEPQAQGAAGGSALASAGSPPVAPAGAYNRTMLAGQSGAIKYNCPRCQAPLESPASEAGIKKPCPSCGQRLQVPAAPPPPPPTAAAPPPGLNKTMLAGDGSAPAAPPIKYNCPRCKKPLEAPASEANTKKPCPSCGQRHQVPAAPPAAAGPNPNKTMLVTDTPGAQPYGGQPGYAAAPGQGVPTAPLAPAPAGINIGGQTVSPVTLGLVAVAALFLLCSGVIVVPALIHGGKTEDAAAAAALKEKLERANTDVESKRDALEKATKFEADIRERINALVAKQATDEQRMHDDLRDALRRISDEKQRRDLEDQFQDKQRRAEEERRKSEEEQKQLLAKAKAEAEAKAKELDQAKQAQQTIIQTPPPVYYYPPYHPRYYSWWW